MPVDHTAIGTVGYAEPFVVAPGGTVSIRASSLDPAGTVQLVRLSHDGTQWTALPIGDERAVVVPHQRLPLGSWAELGAAAVGSAVALWVRVSRYPEQRAELITHGSLALEIDNEGRVVSGSATSAPLDLHRWYHVVGGADWCAVRRRPAPTVDGSVHIYGAPAEHTAPSSAAPVTLARGFDGAIARPRILAAPEEVAPALAAWDLADGIGTQEITGSTRGVLHQCPTRAVPGPDWDGSCLDWRHAPQHYDAIWFHTDDLVDAEWPITLDMQVPPDAPCGVYAAEVTTPAGRDVVPFFVRLRQPVAELAVLLPTMTYLAYANEQAQPPLVEQAPEVAAPFGRGNHLLSWYDRHADGSRVYFASTRRPLMGVRPDHQFRYLGAPHGLSADLALLGWLERKQIAFDVISDHQLDADADLPYRVVVTGGHPEYWTTRMFEGLDRFQAAGGRLAYLGGNGFLWRVATDPARPWLAEMRRGQIENVPLDGESGEDHLQLTGQPAGMWRVVGRPEAPTVGVATTAMGFGDGVPYARTAASDDRRAARIFDGIEARAIGDFGPKRGVVAYETDLANHFLGTPTHALIVATAALPDGFEPFAPSMFPSPSGETSASRRRADMVLFETPSGGAVFATSTIMWSQSLSHAGDDNTVSRVTENVLRWFLEPGPVASER